MTTDNNKLYSAEKLVEVFPKYIYSVIPSEYAATYRKILILMSLYGQAMLQSCSASCTSQNRRIIDCFNMFHAACSAKVLGRDKQADVIINYINGQLNLSYGDHEINDDIIVPISTDGEVAAICDTSNPNEIKFYTNEKDVASDEEFFVQNVCKTNKED